MNIDLIPAGDNPPQSVNVSSKSRSAASRSNMSSTRKSGAIFVDRILHTAMRYPANYGFIPQTLGEDGDPLDCLVMARWPFMPGCVVRARPVAVLFLEDEAGGDEKLLAVPELKTSPFYADIMEGDRPAGDHAPADRAFLHPLQRSGAREMDPGRQPGAAATTPIG